MDKLEGKVEYREYRQEDRESLVELHNKAFPPVTLEYWIEWDKQDVTASVALMGDEVVGCVPFHIRDFVVRPGIAIKAAFEYSVCVREDLRSKGIGSQLMDCAARFLKGRAHVMMVYRGGELSRGYQYYARNNHYDMVYVRRWTWESPDAKPSEHVKIHNVDEMYRREAEVIEVFDSCYGKFGGYPLRSPGHYEMMLHNANWEEVKHDWRFLELTRDGKLMGYLLIGQGHESKQWRVAELAARDGDLDIADALVDNAATLTKNAPLSFNFSEHDPFQELMSKRDAIMSGRARSSMMIMAKPIDPENLGEALWGPNFQIPEAEVMVWSPLREAVIYTGPGKTKRRITLEMKDDILTRLLLLRLDLEQAHRQELVTVVNATGEDVAQISRALPFCRWIHQNVDYI